MISRAPPPAIDARADQPAAGDYHPQASFLDELFELDGTPRPTAVPLVEQLRRLGPAGLIEAGRRRDAIFMQQGITFETSSVGGASHERPFPLDLVPRVLSGQEWRDIKRGLAQRIRALNHFVDDVYHAREIVREGLVPWRLVVSCSHFARAVHGIRPPGGVYTHVAGCDLVGHRRRHMEGDRGQRAHPLGHLLRAGEPCGHGQAGAGAVRLLPQPCRRGVSGGRRRLRRAAWPW